MLDTLIAVWGGVVGGFIAILFAYRVQLLTKGESLLNEARRAQTELDRTADDFRMAFGQDETAGEPDLKENEDKFGEVLWMSLIRAAKQSGISLRKEFESYCWEGIASLRMLEQELRKYQQHVMSQSWSEFAQVEKIVQISSQFRNRERIRSEMSQVDDNNRNFRGSMKAALFVLVLLIVAALVSAFGYKFFALVTLFFSIGIFIQLVLIASGSNKVEIYLPPFRLVKVIPVALVAASLFARFVAAVTPIRKLTGVWNEDAPLIGTVRNYVTEGSSPGGLGPPQSGTKGQANTKP